MFNSQRWPSNPETLPRVRVSHGGSLDRVESPPPARFPQSSGSASFLCCSLLSGEAPEPACLIVCPENGPASSVQVPDHKWKPGGGGTKQSNHVRRSFLCCLNWWEEIPAVSLQLDNPAGQLKNHSLLMSFPKSWCGNIIFYIAIRFQPFPFSPFSPKMKL